MLHKLFSSSLLGCGLLMLSLACSNMDSRPERAEKLKPILVEVNAPATAGDPFQPPLWGQEVRLAFHFIAPPGTEPFTAALEAPQQKPLTLPLPVEAGQLDGAVEVNELPGLQHSIVRARFRVPSAGELSALDSNVEAAPFLRFQYQLRVSDSSRELPIAGDFVAYRDANVPGASWNFQGSEITEPSSANVDASKLDIAATVKNQQAEPLRVAWFVSDGKIKNRRASVTEWEAPGPGAYTLIFTVRGKQSRTGTLAIKSFTVP